MRENPEEDVLLPQGVLFDVAEPELLPETETAPQMDGPGEPPLTALELQTAPRGCGTLFWVVIGIIWIFGASIAGQVVPWISTEFLRVSGMSVPPFVRPLMALGHAIFVVGPLLLLLALWKPQARYRILFETWIVAAFFPLFLLPLRLIPSFQWAESAVPGLIVQLAGLLLFGAFLRWRIRQNPEKQWMPFGAPGPTPFLLLLILMATWFWVGEFGSLFETILQVVVGLLLGRVAMLLLEAWLFTPLSAESRGLGNDFALGGWASSATLYLIGSAFALNGQLLFLPATLAMLAWPLTGLMLAQRRRAGAAWLLGMVVALAFAFSDADELILLLLDSLHEIPGQVLVATWTAIGMSILVGFAMWLLRKRSYGVFVNPPNTLGWVGVGLLWIGAVLLYFWGGVPGFHGDRLFVIFSDQADLSAAYAIDDIDARREYVYTTLVDHARDSQSGLLAALEGWGIAYQPYYLVNAVEVEAGWPMQWWLGRFDGVDRVLQSPVMRPLARLPEPSSGDLEAPAMVQWNLTLIGADRVWEELGVRGAGITIGQSDSGVQFDHPELLDSYRGKGGDHNFNWLDPWMGRDAPYDLGGHGTHTLGSVLGNSVGVAPDAEWFACANLVRNLGNPAFYLDCMQFMLAPYPQGGDAMTDGDPRLAADVLNNSWGCPSIEGCDAESLRVGAEALRAAGIFAAVSAGNDGSGGCGSLNAPLAIYESVFSVGAVDEFGVVADFSSRGPVTVDGSNRTKPDILAPGVDVLSSTPNNTYAAYPGTSMAGPHVAGTVALIWSANPALIGQIDRTEQILAESAQPYDFASDVPDCGDENVTPDNAVGYGILDAFAAVEMALDLRE